VRIERSRLAVAAIMPLYNKRDTVVEAVESMLLQTRLPDEIIIVDDGSTDGSGDLVEARYGSHPLVRIIRQENRGAGAARNAAIRAATAPLLAFLDADDKWLPQRIEKQAAIMTAERECMIVFSAAILYHLKLGTWIEGDRINRKTYLHKEFFRQDCHIACGGVMVRRTALDEVGLFDESLWRSQDTDLWLRVMLRFGFAHEPEPLVWIRCCRPQTIENVERGFVGNDLYFAKHRYTFGRGVRGQAIWRSAYASVLRRHAVWYLSHGYSGKAALKLLKAVRLWPFFDPRPLVKPGLKYALGPRVYNYAVATMRRIAGSHKTPLPRG